MVNYFRAFLFAFAVATLISSCKGKVKPIGQAPLDLLDIDFGTKMSTLYPDKYKSKNWDNYYDIPVGEDTRMIERDTTFINEFSEDQKAVGIEYRQRSSSTGDTLAIAGDQTFSSLSIAFSIDDKIKAIGAETSEISNQQTKKFIQTLSKKYGEAKKLEGEFMSKFTIYEWETKDRIFRYATIFNNEKNTLKLEVDKNQGSIKPMEKTPHHDGYFFVINKAYLKDIETLHTGTFVYIK
jgi:hypothetical protein